MVFRYFTELSAGQGTLLLYYLTAKAEKSYMSIHPAVPKIFLLSIYLKNCWRNFSDVCFLLNLHQRTESEG